MLKKSTRNGEGGDFLEQLLLWPFQTNPLRLLMSSCLVSSSEEEFKLATTTLSVFSAIVSLTQLDQGGKAELGTVPELDRTVLVAGDQPVALVLCSVFERFLR